MKQRRRNKLRPNRPDLRRRQGSLALLLSAPTSTTTANHEYLGQACHSGDLRLALATVLPQCRYGLNYHDSLLVDGATALLLCRPAIHRGPPA